MVGIVLVSHSRSLAEGLLALVRQMASPELKVAIAAGTGEGHREIGTDAIEIVEAIQSVSSAEGVVVLMDLGSALLSAETALEFLPPELAKMTYLCAAPLVEGAVAAAVQAGLGSDVEAVCAEAGSALGAKQEQLGRAAPAGAATEHPGSLPLVDEIILRLKNLHGLHARPAARFVQTAAAFKAEIRVRNLTNGRGPASARSLNGVATLAAVGGHQIGISAQGQQAAEALEALRRLVESGFGETEAEESPKPAPVQAITADTAPGDFLQAIPVSEGFALGPLLIYRPTPPPVSDEKANDPAGEMDRLTAALARAEQEIRAQKARLRGSLSEEQAAIFDAHVLILQDPETLAVVQDWIQRGENAAFAWNAVAEETAATYRALPDDYLQARAADVLDVAAQVLFALSGRQAARLELDSPVILAAQDLTPTETSQLDFEKVTGILTVGGGPTSHSAILARALGIPAISGVAPALLGRASGTLLGLDGGAGRVWIEPSSEVQQNLTQQRAAWFEQRRRLLKESQPPAYTADGVRIEVVGNAGSLQDAHAAVANGAEGIGLLRTEFLFLTRQTPPSEDEQTQVLREIGAALGDRPVIVRTLDAGGDKELPYAGLGEEANPFLGVRAIRVSLARPELFQPQLRAILRAGQEANFRIMFPMVADIAEVLQAKAALEEAHLALEREKIPHRWPLETGIMVEVPSAAVMAEAFAPHVDFFSVGTNDLTQYTLAAERGNPALAHLADALHPAVLRLIGQVCAAADKHGRWVGVCGELGGDPLAVPILVGLGVRELSMTSTRIPRAKEVLRGLNLPAARGLAEKSLACSDPASVRGLAEGFMKTMKGGPG